MVDECGCDLAPVLAAEGGGLIPYLKQKKSTHDIQQIPVLGDV